MKNNHLFAVFALFAFFMILAGSPAMAEEKISYWGSTYTANYANLAEGVTRELNILHRVQFQIEGQYAHVGVVNLDQTRETAGIEVVNPVQRASIIAGQVKEFDVTGDNMSDIRVSLNSVVNNLANITIITVPAGESKNLSAVQKDEAPIASKGIFLNAWVLITIAAVVVLLGAAAYFYFRKKK